MLTPKGNRLYSKRVVLAMAVDILCKLANESTPEDRSELEEGIKEAYAALSHLQWSLSTEARRAEAQGLPCLPLHASARA